MLFGFAGRDLLALVEGTHNKNSAPICEGFPKGYLAVDRLAARMDVVWSLSRPSRVMPGEAPTRPHDLSLAIVPNDYEAKRMGVTVSISPPALVAS
jgi:hypothetical protein